MSLAEPAKLGKLLPWYQGRLSPLEVQVFNQALWTGRPQFHHVAPPGPTCDP